MTGHTANVDEQLFGRVTRLHFLERMTACRCQLRVRLQLAARTKRQNDELFRDEILAGSYPTACERPINRVDVRDLGRAIARALLDESLPSGAYPVVGPRALDGDTCAAAWSAALRRSVSCERNQSLAFAALGRKLSPKKQHHFVNTFSVLRSFELKALQKDVDATAELIDLRAVDGTSLPWRN